MSTRETPFTNASELARLAKLTRQGINPILARGDIPEAVRAWVDDHPVWRIPTFAADRWLGDRHKPTRWVKREGIVGAIEDVWVGVD